MRVLSLAALALSAYITWTTYGGGQLAGCGESGAGCEEVIHTRWSQWFGLPVSVAGGLVYAAIALTVFKLSAESSATQWRRLIFLSVLAAASGLWFISLQLFVIKDICVYCTAVHSCGIILAVLTLFNAPVEEKPQTPKEAKRRGDVFTASDSMRWGLLGLAGVVVLAGGQMLSSYSPPVQSPPITKVPPTSALTGREVTLAGGRFKMKLGEFPIFGSPNAQRVVVMIFDYTCPACRHLHPQLFDAFKPHEDRAAIVMIPSPLDAQCNPGITATAYAHQNACTYAKIGLAIWNTNPEAYPSFDQFMFAGDFPPSLQDARAVADHLVGKDVMDAALASPRYDHLLGFGVQLFYSPVLDRKVLPTLITPEGVMNGTPAPEQLSLLF
jgi:uncharacterized membrane protein